MVSTELTEDQEALRALVAEFAREVVAPVARHHDATRTFPYEVVKQMGDLGLFGLPFPEEYGGSGGDAFTLFLAIEELARVDSSVAITLEAGVSLGALPVWKFGTEEQRRRWVPELASGAALGAFGADRGGGRHRRRGPAHPGAAAGRDLARGRQQGLHHQLRHRHHAAGSPSAAAPGRPRPGARSCRACWWRCPRRA